MMICFKASLFGKNIKSTGLPNNIIHQLSSPGFQPTKYDGNPLNWRLNPLKINPLEDELSFQGG